MAFVVAPSKNRMLDRAWKGFRAEQRAEKKTKTEPDDVHTKPAKAKQIAPVVHKNAGKVHTPAAKPKRGGRK